MSDTAFMSEHHAEPEHPSDGHDGSGHAPDDHADDGHGHGAPAEPLGPVDRQAWAAAIGGSLPAVVLVVALYLTISA